MLARRVSTIANATHRPINGARCDTLHNAPSSFSSFLSGALSSDLVADAILQCSKSYEERENLDTEFAEQIKDPKLAAILVDLNASKTQLARCSLRTPTPKEDIGIPQHQFLPCPWERSYNLCIPSTNVPHHHTTHICLALQVTCTFAFTVSKQFSIQFPSNVRKPCCLNRRRCLNG